MELIAYCSQAMVINEKINEVMIRYDDLNVACVSKGLMDKYAEWYIRKNFEMSEDGWIRRIENDETV
ncbi:hypothetical protein AA989_10725 [Enterococcus cecorum]|nr:hypothetical protein AA989_10725 [Enterococcus cecorum]